MWEQVSVTCASSHWMGCPVELECSAKAEVAMSLLRTESVRNSDIATSVLLTFDVL